MKTIQWQSKKFVSMVIALFVVLSVIMIKGCGGGGGSSSDILSVVAPGAPQDVAIIASKPNMGSVTLTLTWNAPITGGVPTSYEIYSSTTAPTVDNPVFQPANHVISLPVTTSEYNTTTIIDANATYWVVAAKNAAGETPSNVVTTSSFGNNFAAAMIFADGYGITGLLLDANKSWTEDNLSAIDYNTGLRPSITETLSVFPYFDPSSTVVVGNVTYYLQKTASTWQGEWKNGKDTEHNVTAKWGDNLISQTNLTTNSVIRIEMVLTEALTTAMKSYTMKSLGGSKIDEVYGTDKTTYENNTSFVFATNAHLKIQKVDDNGTALEAPLYDQPLWTGDGPGFFAAEINVAGNFTYGFVWNVKDTNTTYPKTGKWRITFSLDGTSPVGTLNNTFIKTATNGVLDSDTSAHIDIDIK